MEKIYSENFSMLSSSLLFVCFILLGVYNRKIWNYYDYLIEDGSVKLPKSIKREKNISRKRAKEKAEKKRKIIEG